MTTLTGKTREELAELLDRADERLAYAEASELRARLATICSNCGREGARDRFDRHSIYAGRWHDECETEADAHRARYMWAPGDEPLEEEE